MMKKLSDKKTLELLKKNKIALAGYGIAKKKEEASRIAKKLGFPVVMKISSPDIIHKTDSGGVILDIGSKEEAERAYEKLMAKARKKKAKVEGVLIQEQVKGREVVIGSKFDVQFGPVIMVGLGGIFVEVLKDVSFRLIPIDRGDAREMIEELKSYPILKGVRGEKGVNLRLLEDFLLKVSSMVEKNPSIKELDINPLIINNKSGKAADARVLVK
jgi:acyl-CoA synthetase (NDP forming)